jgi:hypothetical protein
MGRSLDQDESQAYFRKVELAWSLARGCQIIVSPLEFEEIERWHDAEIPLPVVLRAIELFVEKKRRAKRGKGFLLKDAAATVQKCWKEYVDIHAGEGEEGDLLENKRKELVRRLRKLTDAWPAQAAFVDETVAQLKALPLHEIAGFDAIDAALGDLDEALVEQFAASLAPETLAELRGEVSDFLDEHEDPAFFRKLLTDSLRSYFGLPKLTLLG